MKKRILIELMILVGILTGCGSNQVTQENAGLDMEQVATEEANGDTETPYEDTETSYEDGVQEDVGDGDYTDMNDCSLGYVGDDSDTEDNGSLLDAVSDRLSSKKEEYLCVEQIITTYDGSENSSNTYTNSYNEYGDLVESRIINENGEEVGYIEHEYADSKLIHTKYNNYMPDMLWGTGEYTYEYDKNYMKKTMTGYDCGFEEYFYDDNGQCTMVKRESVGEASGEKTTKTEEYQYDEAGNVVWCHSDIITIIDGKEYRTDFVREYEYDGKGNLLTMTSNQDGNIYEQICSNDYDENGNLMWHTILNDDNETYERYEYDENGNVSLMELGDKFGVDYTMEYKYEKRKIKKKK